MKTRHLGDDVADLAAQIVAAGLRHAFGVTGSGLSLRLITALEEAGAQYHPVAHEAAGALMAGAVTRVSGRPSASVSVKGPGLASMVPGIVSNALEGYPALSFSEAYGPADSPHRAHKRLDHRSLLSGIVKAHVALDDLSRIPQVLDLARAEIPGPVHLDLCLDEHGRDLDVRGLHAGSSTKGSTDFRFLLERARRPVLIVGSLGWRRSWASLLVPLTVPVFTTAAGKGLLDERLPHSAGVYTGDGKDLAPEATIIDQADLVIGIGLRHTEVLSPRQFRCPLILIDEVDGGLHEGFAAAVHTLGPNTESVVDDVLAALATKEWIDELPALVRSMRDGVLSEGWTPAQCFDVLDTLERPHALVLDTGSFCTIGEHCWRAWADRPFLGSSNGRFMGTSIPSAIGFALARPEVPVICAVGDGGVRPYISELTVTVNEALPLCVVFMTDGLYNSVASVPQPIQMSRRAVTVPNPSWQRTVETLGIPAYRVNTRKAFNHVVQTWPGTGPLFVEAVFDPEPYRQAAARLR